MKLLTCVDIWFRAEETVQLAAGWAERLGAEVDLVYVDELPSGMRYIQDPAVRDVVMRDWDRAREMHQSRLNVLMNVVPQNLRGEARYLSGEATLKIPKLAEGYDALVLSTHQRKGLSRLWMGSVAERLVRASPVPVIVVHLSDQPAS